MFSFKESAAPSCSLHILENICNGKDCQARLSLCNRWALSYDLVLLQKNVFSNRPFCLFGSFAKTIVVGNHPLCNRPAFSYDLDLLQKKLSTPTVLLAKDWPFRSSWIYCEKKIGWQPSSLQKTCPFV